MDYDTVHELWYPTVAEYINGKRCLHLQDGTTVDGTQKESFWSYLDEIFVHTNFFSKDHNYLIVNDCGTMLSLENIRFSETTIDICNQQGLTIYLYENIILDNKKTKFITSLNAMSTSKFPTRVNDKNIFCLDLESVNKFVKNNNLINVKLCLGDYGIKKIFQNKYSFEIDDISNIFLLSLLGSAKNMYGIHDYTNHFDSKLINKKFWSGNWRYALHRKIIASKLSKLSGNITWAFTDKLTEIEPNNRHYQSLIEGNQHLISSVPRIMDIDFDSVDSSTNNVPLTANTDFCPSFTDLPIDFYAECFVSVVTESEFYRPTACISDKVFNSIKCGRPFILVSSPRSLEYLKKLGFKTFDGYWSEKYDKINNHNLRMDQIIDIINCIEELSIDECKKMYDDMLPIIQHNFDNLYKLRNFYGSTII